MSLKVNVRAKMAFDPDSSRNSLTSHQAFEEEHQQAQGSRFRFERQEIKVNTRETLPS